MNQERGNAPRREEPNMKAHFIRETDEHGYADGWLRVSRQDIKALGIEVTSASRQDDKFIYLWHDGTDTSDADAFYTALMLRGAYFEQAHPHVIKLRGDEQTFEVIDGLSAVRDLAPVA